MDRSDDVSRNEPSRNDSSREDRELRELLLEAHRDEAVPPPFDALWERVQTEATFWHRPPRHRPPGPRFALIGALAGLVLALGIVWTLREPSSNPAPPTPGPLVAEVTWDRTWSGWEGPLDFLLDSPGRSYLESVPTLVDETTLGEATLSETTLSEQERRTPDAL
jgi:hypothetical protein